jgi:hypothetical protein
LEKNTTAADTTFSLRKHGLFDPYPGYFLCHLRVSTIAVAIAGDAEAIVTTSVAIAAATAIVMPRSHRRSRHAAW